MAPAMPKMDATMDMALYGTLWKSMRKSLLKALVLDKQHNDSMVGLAMVEKF